MTKLWRLVACLCTAHLKFGKLADPKSLEKLKKCWQVWQPKWFHEMTRDVVDCWLTNCAHKLCVNPTTAVSDDQYASDRRI